MDEYSIEATLKLDRPMYLREMVSLITKALLGDGRSGHGRVMVVLGQEIRVTLLAEEVPEQGSEVNGMRLISVEAERLGGPRY